MRTGRPREFDLDQKLDTCGAGVLAAGLRRHRDRRPDRGAGHQPAEPVRGVRQQGVAVPAACSSALLHAARRSTWHWHWRSRPRDATVEHLLRGAADATTGRGEPSGCLGVQGALATGPDSDPVRRTTHQLATVGRVRHPGPAGQGPGRGRAAAGRRPRRTGPLRVRAHVRHVGAGRRGCHPRPAAPRGRADHVRLGRAGRRDRPEAG